MTKMIRALMIAAVLTGCSVNASAPGTVTEEQGPPDPSPTEQPTVPPSVIYPTIGALHEKALARTCALNNGVCHNSKEYPDLRAPSGLFAAVNKPCNVNAPAHDQVQDVCEPIGDRLVLTDGTSKLLDVEIASVEIPAGSEPAKFESVVVRAADDVPAVKDSTTTTLEVHRGATVFTLKNASIASITGRAITLAVKYADPAVRSFLDDRTYPWHEGIVRVGDANGNGVVGHLDPKSAGHMSIVPGDPNRSFLILRLIDETKGDLMPRQCREWDDVATRALGCWIKGLKTDAEGNVTNFEAPIDYASCDFNPVGQGRCKAIEASGGLTAVEGIAARSCGGSGCHVDEKSPAGGLDLSAGKLLENVVSKQSSQTTGMRVVPGKPDESYFLCKLDPTCTTRRGALMPAGAKELSPSELAIVRQWIADGAK